MTPRAVSRLTHEYLLRFVDRVRRASDGDMLKGLVFLGVSHLNIRHMDEEGETWREWSQVDAPPPDSLRRPTSAGAVAALLGLPKETVRRKIRELVSERNLHLAPGGVITPRRVFLRADNIKTLARIEADLRWLVERLKAVAPEMIGDYEIAQNIAHVRRVGRINTAFAFRAIHGLRDLFEGDLLSGLVFSTINAANVWSPGAPDSTEAPLADDQRRPISALALARGMGIPAETVRRHARRLEDRGFCVTVKGGLIAPAAVLQDPRMQAAGLATAENLTWLIDNMARSGMLVARASNAA